MERNVKIIATATDPKDKFTAQFLQTMVDKPDTVLTHNVPGGQVMQVFPLSIVLHDAIPDARTMRCTVTTDMTVTDVIWVIIALSQTVIALHDAHLRVIIKSESNGVIMAMMKTAVGWELIAHLNALRIALPSLL